MYISEIQIGNYKSFHRPEPLNLELGFNVVIGQNNVGKTVLLECLRIDVVSKPHRSLKTLASVRDPIDPDSTFGITFSLSREELLKILEGNGDKEFALPAITEFTRSVGCIDHSPESLKRLFESVLNQEQHTFKTLISTGTGWLPARRTSFGGYVQQPGNPPNINFAVIEVARDRSIKFKTIVTREGAQSEVGVYVAQMLRSRIYRFSAERFSVGVCRQGYSPMLAHNVANLPEVLHLLQANKYRFNHFVKAVHDIFPQVFDYSARTIANEQVEILVWMVDPASERIDLAIPLSECGTGIGQVLAILYVVLNSDEPQTILIDEPQSFLHPGALRNLIEILRLSPQKHRYLIATHSPTVITSSNPATITMLQFKDSESTFRRIEPNQREDLQLFLDEIGARLSDVFGADSILWVEVPTEEKCFPKILEKIAKKDLMGISILGVRRTGDLEGKDAEKIFEMYNKLSDSNSLLPHAVAFILDKECHSEQKKKELIHKRRNKLNFLPLIIYEN